MARIFAIARSRSLRMLGAQALDRHGVRSGHDDFQLRSVRETMCWMMPQFGSAENHQFVAANDKINLIIGVQTDRSGRSRVRGISVEATMKPRTKWISSVLF